MAATYPSRIDICPWGAQEHLSGSWSINAESGLGTGRIISNGAQNASVGWKVALRAGTWTIGLISYFGGERGIATVTLDATTVGTIDTYNAGGAANSYGSLSGITVGADGVYLVKFTMATKNASSSNYYFSPQHIVLQRTGA